MASRTPVGSSLRDQHGLHLQIGFVLSLALLLAAAQVPLSAGDGTGAEVQEQETVDLRHVQQTRQEKTPTAPPKPPVPRAVPDDKVIEPSNRDFDASLNLGPASTQTASAQTTGGQTEGPPSPVSPGPTADEVFVHVQKKPDCGGLQVLRGKTRYPPAARKFGLEGRVFVQFVVEENGQVTDPRVVQGVHEVLNQAALRAVKRLDCTPGKQRNRSVKVKMTMPVIFALDDDT